MNTTTSSIGSKGSAGAGTATKQLWKVNDERARKSGRRSTVYHPSGATYTGEWAENSRTGTW